MADPVNQSTLEALAADVGARLLARGEVLAVAESCTGGWVGQCMTAIAGSSQWFDGGFITYSNTAKHTLLGVPSMTIARHGAVSEPTVRAMAQGVLERTPAHWSLAISGVAGPSGGSPKNPVGTVCFAWAQKDGGCLAETCHFDGNRETVRAHSVHHALHKLREQLG